MDTETYPGQGTEPLYSTADVQRILGLSRTTIFKLIRRGELVPTRIVPGSLRFDPHDVRDFIESHRDTPGVVSSP